MYTYDYHNNVIDSLHTFISILNRSFYRIGLFIGARPYHFFIFTLSISLLTLGIFQLNFSQCLQDGFVSRYSQARIEHDIKVKFDGIDTTAVQRFVALVRRKDRGSLLGREELRRVLEVKKYINEEILVTKDDTSYSHSQLCEDYCESNKLLEIFEKCVDDLYHNENVLIDHPKSLCGDFTIPIGIHIFGITRKLDI
uniref:Transmembrane protein n=1 Tax=Heterorhabditis bacteriophora TaxID=37862 RepID=A0A1I7WSP2_HETBA